MFPIVVQINTDDEKDGFELFTGTMMYFRVLLYVREFTEQHHFRTSGPGRSLPVDSGCCSADLNPSNLVFSPPLQRSRNSVKNSTSEASSVEFSDRFPGFADSRPDFQTYFWFWDSGLSRNFMLFCGPYTQLLHTGCKCIERLHERIAQSVLFLPTDLSMRAECMHEK